MSNPFNKLNPNNHFDYSPYKNAYQLLRNSNNPMQVLNSLAQSNSQLRPIMNMLNQGGNPQQIFYGLCQQRGINPDEFIKNITGS